MFLFLRILHSQDLKSELPLESEGCQIYAIYHVTTEDLFINEDLGPVTFNSFN